MVLKASVPWELLPCSCQERPCFLSTHAADVNGSWQSCRQEALGLREVSEEDILQHFHFSLSSSPLVGKCLFGSDRISIALWAWVHHLGTAFSASLGWTQISARCPSSPVEIPSPRSQQADLSEILAAVSIRKPKWSRSALQEMVELLLRQRGPRLQQRPQQQQGDRPWPRTPRRAKDKGLDYIKQPLIIHFLILVGNFVF